GDLLAGLQVEQVDDCLPARGAASLRNFVDFGPVDFARGGEEQDVGVRRGDEQVLDEIFFLGGGADLPPTAAPLGAVEADGVALDVALVRDRDRHVLLDDHVLDRDLGALIDDLRAPFVGVQLLHLLQLLENDLVDLAFIPKDLAVTRDLLHGLGVLFEDLVAFEAGQALQTHVEDGLCLDFAELELLYQAALRGAWIRRLANQRDDRVEVIQRDL